MSDVGRRIAQPEGTRGSLKWIQRAVEERWSDLETPIRQRIGGDDAIDWVSPRRDDDFAEYRDAAFLHRLGLVHLAPALAEFWPAGGPQWDALGRTAGDVVILVEAKAHIDEFCTAGTGAGEASRARIVLALERVASALGSNMGGRWSEQFYQYANRLAHLWFLRSAGVNAFLVQVGFVGDSEMKGPAHAETWLAAHRVADHALGLAKSHPLSRFVIHAHPAVHGRG
jgi:hypothetical protein